MSHCLESCVIRLLDPKGQVRGTGFLVAPDLAVTCAHVVAACGGGPGGTVTFALHLDGQPRQAVVLTEHWRDPDMQDIAFLCLDAHLPAGATPALLCASRGCQGHSVLTFGYPEVGKVEGLWGHGAVRGPVREAGLHLLQLDSSEITRGFSGAPLWDEQAHRVVGMVTSVASPDRMGKLRDVAFATPVEALQEACPGLALSPPVETDESYSPQAIRRPGCYAALGSNLKFAVVFLVIVVVGLALMVAGPGGGILGMLGVRPRLNVSEVVCDAPSGQVGVRFRLVFAPRVEPYGAVDYRMDTPCGPLTSQAEFAERIGGTVYYADSIPCGNGAYTLVSASVTVGGVTYEIDDTGVSYTVTGCP